ncbi:MAG: multidrug efflux system membrane fusion protein [Candidatus Latescibacterota bacterium]|jgi:multidrug efflux system membrane fusion protein
MISWIHRCRFFAVGLVFCVSCGEDISEPEPVIRPVRYEKVTVSGGERARIFSGTSQAGLESRLSFRVPGIIKNLAVKLGDAVQVGQLIAELDSRDFQLKVQQADAALSSAQAQARNAQSNYDRIKALYENRNASKNDLDVARATAESADAQANATQNQLELARSQLSYTRLTVPVAGSIAKINIEENENVSPGQQIALLTSDSQLEVEVAIPEILIARIREGVEVKVHFDALPGRTFTARVTEVGVSSTSLATTFPVTVLLQHRDADCRPGMATEVTFLDTDNKGDRILVPPVAVSEDRQGRFVFVVNPENDGLGTVHRHTVKIGDLTKDGMEVLGGIQGGDLVVTAGISRIQDGQKVRLLAQ